MSDGPRRPEFPKDDDFDYERIFTEPDQPDAPLKDRLPLKKIKRVTIAVAVALLSVFLLVFALRLFNPPGSPMGEKNLTIERGASTTAIAEQLAAEDVVPNATAFRLWVKKEGDASFQAGEYTFRQNMSAGEALAVLRAGPKQRTNRLVIPEGLRLTQIADRVGQLPGMSAARFLEVARSGRVRSDFQPAGSNNLEGLVFPDTYIISEADNEERLLRRMVSEFEDQARGAGIENSLSARSRTPYEMIIIASLIESEARTDEDRGKISQVIENRLQQNMKLQIDATVLYALGNNKQSVSLEDLKVASPYNTYLNAGLPPAPISAPGAESLRAALEPTPGPWLFYVIADEDGSHAFATTFAEHQRNVKSAQDRKLY